MLCCLFYSLADQRPVITHHALGYTDEAQRLWRGLIDQDPRYRDPDWVKTELNWVDPLVEAARALIASL